jgi:outer membrane protein OmpA-like peptidoglycan-associated protein
MSASTNRGAGGASAGRQVRLALALLTIAVPPAPALDLRYLFLSGDKIRLTERADLRRYEDGKFVGLAYREVRGILSAQGDKAASRLEGEFYVFEETKHDARLVAKRIDDVVPVSLTVRWNGESELDRGQADPGYPSSRSFPVLPAGSVEPGESWQAYGVRVVEPYRDGKFTRVKIYVDYRFGGTEMREGREVAMIRAQYAVRYKAGDDPAGDDRIIGISGKHVVTITYDPEAARPSFMSDQMEEQYSLRDGKSVAFKGFILTWFEGIEPLDRVRVAKEVTDGLKKGGVENVDVSQGDRGVTLTVKDIHFVADQATVLPDELPRLQLLAQTLAKVPNRSFLVLGHTAQYGSVETQESLSVDRAKAIVDYLVSQGIEARRFIYEGRGAREPVAQNDTEENMARNRRVEIVILED